MVMVFHFPWPKPAGGVLHVAVRSLALGQTGVDLFFVLSGFLITRILLRARGSPHYLRNFYFRRTLRIFPLYYAVLLGYFVVVPLIQGLALDGTSLTVYAGYGQSIAALFRGSHVEGPAHFWSLAVEEHFYFVWPFLVMMLERRPLKVALGTIVGLALLMRALLVPTGIDVSYLSFCRMDALAIGSLIAVALVEPGALARLANLCRRAASVAVPALAVIYVLTSGSGAAVQQVLKFPLIAGFHAMLLIFVLASSPTSVLGVFFSSPIMRTLGKYSYGLYVFHPFVFSACHGRVPGGLLAEVVASFAASGALAFASWHLFEKRFLSLKAAFEYRSPKSSAEAAASPMAAG
jgi:peptidoglycan/LPS O-acetylase OafA/YrhL